MNDTLELPQEHKAKKFFEKLREKSVFKQDPIPEWSVIHDIEGDGSSTCICSTPIQYQFTIRNKLNGMHLVIGSECVKRFGIEFVCDNCGASLGNITQRLIKKDYLCPLCKKEKQRQQEAEERRERIRQQMEQTKIQARINTLSRFRLYWFGVHYGKSFPQVVQDASIEYLNRLINIESKNKSLEAFEEYVKLTCLVEEFPKDANQGTQGEVGLG